MAIPQRDFNDDFNDLLKRLSDQDHKSILDYMNYLILSRRAKQAWDAIPEVDEPFSEEEKQQLESVKNDDETISLEELRRELDL